MDKPTSTQLLQEFIVPEASKGLKLASSIAVRALKTKEHELKKALFSREDPFTENGKPIKVS